MKETKLDKVVKRTRRVVITIIAVLVAALTALFILLTNNIKQEAGLSQKSKPTIALVNEDIPSTFNKQSYNFGKNFVSLVSNDTKYNWQVLSRAVANKAYDNQSVDAVIYIPQDFSKDILTLQDLDPTKAEVDYKVLASQSQLSERLLQDKIGIILFDFNQNIVKMYYASVAGNVAEAQGNMNMVVESQNGLLRQLNQQVYGPFQETSQNYSTVISFSNSLKTMNSAWIQQQNSFTKATTGTLQSTSLGLNNQLPLLQKYFDTQKQIGSINAANANLGINNQAISDNSFYYDQFTKVKNNMQDVLNNFYSVNTATDGSKNESGLLADFQAKISNYNTLVGGVRDDLNTQRNTLNDKRTDLYDLETKLYQQYFNQDSNFKIDGSNFDKFHGNTDVENDQNARAALAQMIIHSFIQTDNFTGQYLDQLKGMLSQLPWDSGQYSDLFNALGPNGNQALSQDDINQYMAELKVLNNYGHALKATPGTLSVGTIPSDDTNQVLKRGQLSVRVPAASQYSVVLPKTDGFSLGDLPDGVTNNNGTLTLDNRYSGEDANGNEISSTKPKTFTISYTINFGKATSATVSFNVKDGSSNQLFTNSGQFVLLPTNKINNFAGKSEFKAITQYLSQIDNLAKLITFIYGAPGAKYSDLPDSTSLSDFNHLSPQSIYNLYGNVDLTDDRFSKIEAQLDDDDITDFESSGTENINDIIKSIQSINSVIEGNKDQDGNPISGLNFDIDSLSKNLPNDYFTSTMQGLKDWVEKTEQNLLDSYNSWTQNKVTELPIKPWEERKTDETAIYYANKDNDDLYQQILTLMSMSAKTVDEVAKSARVIKDNADQFDGLVKTVTTTQDSAKKVISNTSNLLNNGNKELAKNKNYSKQFSSVLSNTRAAGADSNSIFDFFARPLTTKDLTPKAKSSFSNSFDWRWLIIFIGGILLGSLGMLVLAAFFDRTK